MNLCAMREGIGGNWQQTRVVRSASGPTRADHRPTTWWWGRDQTRSSKHTSNATLNLSINKQKANAFLSSWYSPHQPFSLLFPDHTCLMLRVRHQTPNTAFHRWDLSSNSHQKRAPLTCKMKKLSTKPQGFQQKSFSFKGLIWIIFLNYNFYYKKKKILNAPPNLLSTLTEKFSFIISWPL